MALFRKSKEQHLEVLESMNNPLEIQEYFQREGINMAQLNEYLEGRNILKGAENGVNYQDNRTYIEVVQKSAKSIVRDRANKPLAHEQVEQNQDTGILWDIIGVAVVSSLVLLMLYLVGTSLVDALTPSPETAKSLEKGVSTFGTVFLYVVCGIVLLYVVALFTTGRGGSGRRDSGNVEDIEENEITKKFREERARKEVA